VNVYSDFTIPALGRHVTVFYEHQVQKLSLFVSLADLELYPRQMKYLGRHID
jgi:hypothetical protein